MKIEPKTFFANERTFLKWVHISVTMGGMGGVILGFESSSKYQLSHNDDEASLYSGAMFIVLGIVVTLYSMRVFWWRAKMIRGRIDGPFHDAVGPFLLGWAIIFALGATLFFSVIKRRRGGL